MRFPCPLQRPLTTHTTPRAVLVMGLSSTSRWTHTMSDMEHEQHYKSAITITEPPGQHTEYTRRGELRHPRLAREAASGSSCSRAMDGSVQQRLGRAGRRDLLKQAA